MKKIFRMAAFMLALGSMTAGFTSCGEEDENGTDVNNNIEEQINFDGLNVKAQTNGQVLIDGKVTANTKIKSLVLASDEEGKNVIVDLLKSGDQTKAKEINEAGEKQKTFTLDIPTAAVDVQTMYLVGKTRGDKKATSQITETLNYTIGASKSTAGSYLSIFGNKQMTMDVAKSEAAEVIAESSEDGYSVTGLKKASTAKNAEIAAKAGKVALYQNGESVASIKEGGVIITASGAICKIVKFDNNTSTGDAPVEGITMKGGLGAIKSVDVSAATANFSK